MAESSRSQGNLNWVLALAAGVVALGFGIYLLIDSEDATSLIGGLIAIALLAGSLVHIAEGLRRGATSLASRLTLLSGGVGATVGLIVAADLLYDVLDPAAQRVILASGLIVYGVLGLIGLVSNRAAPDKLRTLLVCLLALAYGGLLVWNSQDDQLNARWFAIALIVTGLVLIGVGLLIHRRQTHSVPGSTPAATPAGDPRGSLPDRSGGARRDDTTTPAAEPEPAPASRSGAFSPRPTMAPPVDEPRPVSSPSDPSAPAAPSSPSTATATDDDDLSYLDDGLADDHNFDPFTGERVRSTADDGTAAPRPATPDGPPR